MMLARLLSRALRRLRPGWRAAFASARLAQARAFAQAGELEAAAGELELGLDAQPANALAWQRLGDVRFELALIDEAIAAYREALVREPRLLRAHSSLLFALAHREDDPRALLDEHRRWGARANARPPGPARAFSNSREAARRLRVAYLSADFRAHAISMFIEPILAGHDPAQIEVYCYDNAPSKDGVAARLRGYAATWRDIQRLDSAALAAQAHADCIDILVELCGHTAGNRLTDLAQRLAPVQATYLGYHGSTGLAAMDYRITDALADPPGQTENDYVERLARMPHCLWCYRSPAHVRAPEPAPRPGPAITFGSLNNLRKITPRMLGLWAEILRRLPQARLLMASAGDGPAMRSNLARLAQLGIEARRVELSGWLQPAKFAELHARIDIALDTYPFNGGATTIGALELGVPVVSLAGRSPASRCGRTILTNAGLPELATGRGEDFVETACALAGDRERLADLKARLPAMLRRSPIMDERGFVTDLEALYRKMWMGFGVA
jgi:predicted O-linked N-acetylglucosamine transferase (SPINDLY family)